MALSDILAFASVASLLVMSPGPNGLLIAKTVPTSGRMAGFANVLGFVFAFYVHGLLAVLGVSVLLLKSALAFTILKYVGAAYLMWIGVKALYGAYKGIETKQDIAPAKRKRTFVKAMLEGFLTNALNPKVSMFYLAAFPQFITVGETTAMSAFSLVILHSIMNAIWFCAMVLLIGKLTSFAQSGRFQRWLKAVTGVAFIGFGAKLASYQN